MSIFAAHATYSFVRNYYTIPNIPEYAASGGKGDCGVQALLFITLCRCVGIPAPLASRFICNSTGYR